jgi:hypothetical protein
MSAEANKWSKYVDCPSPSAKRVLRELSDYADAEGRAWPLVPTLATVVGVGERQIIRLLNELEQAGLIEHESWITPPGSDKNRPVYRLDMPDTPPFRPDPDLKPRGGQRYAKAKGDMDVTLKGDTGATPKGDMGVTHNCVGKLSVANAPSARARDPEFERFWLTFPEDVRFISDRSKARAAMAVVEPVYGLDRLTAAAERWKAAPAVRKQDHQPTIQTWLTSERFLEFLPTVAAEAAKGSAMERCGFDGPAEIRTALVLARDEAWTASHLDPARWDGAAIHARTTTARDRLREALKRTAFTDLRVLGPTDAPPVQPTQPSLLLEEQS